MKKNITVNEDTFKRFKALAEEKGMKYDPLIKLIITQSNKYELMKGL